jgi:SAM-dependent methyltransferase
MSVRATAGAKLTEDIRRCLCGDVAVTPREVVGRDEVTGELFSYRECAACGLERIVQRPTSAEIGRYYPQTYYAYSGAVQMSRSPIDRLKRVVYRIFYGNSTERSKLENRFRALLAIGLHPLRFRSVLAFRQPQERRVFEFGAAIGNDLMEFRAAGWEVAGCEPSAKACDVAMQRGIGLQNCAAESAKLPRGRFSCVLLNNVLEHLHDPAAVLQEARAGLMNDGALVLVVPNHASWSARLFGAPWPGYDPPRHLWGFTPRSIRRLLERNAFSIEYINQIAPQRWCYEAVVAGTRSPGGATRWRVLASKVLPILLLPFGLLAATLGHGDFMKIVARKVEPNEPASTRAA